jgi:two-component system cell cycle response regulator
MQSRTRKTHELERTAEPPPIELAANLRVRFNSHADEDWHVGRNDAQLSMVDPGFGLHEATIEPPPRSVSAGAVLVVDDDDDMRFLVRNCLTRAELPVLEASSGEQAVELASAHADSIDAIVLDVMMSGMDGFEVVRRLQRNPRTALIPVLMMTGKATQESDIVRGVETGAIDYLAKPVPLQVMLAKLRAACARTRDERRLRAQLSRAEQTAMIDPLTGLYNRWYLETRIREETAHALRHDEPFALVLLDLDHFKSVNDTFGHAEGDRVLVHFANAVRSILRRDDVAFRYGGEEFILLLRACDAAHARRVTERLREQLEESPITLGGAPRVVTFSAGVAVADASTTYASGDIVVRADVALYRAKRGGRNRIELG